MHLFQAPADWPACAAPAAPPAAPSDCAESVLTALSIPAALSRSGSTGAVAHSSAATYACAGGAAEVMMSESGSAGRFVAGQTVTLTCGDGAITDAPSTWPVCIDGRYKIRQNYC